jgi:hypothetical protein
MFPHVKRKLNQIIVPCVNTLHYLSFLRIINVLLLFKHRSRGFVNRMFAKQKVSFLIQSRSRAFAMRVSR